MKLNLKKLYLPVMLGLLGSVNFVNAQVIGEPEQQPLVRLLREFSVFLNVILLILVVLLLVSLRGALKYLGGKGTWKDKLKIIWSFLSKEPAQMFSQLAQRDKTGTYLLPYDAYKRLHSLGQKTFFRALGLIVLKISILVFLIYGLSLLGHYSRAFEAKSLESNNFLLQLDK